VIPPRIFVDNPMPLDDVVTTRLEETEVTSPFSGLMMAAVGSSEPPLRARSANESFVEEIERAAVAELIEAMLNGREGRKILRQHGPLAAGRGDILDGVPDLAQQGFTRAPDARRRRHERLDNRPLRIRARNCQESGGMSYN
jgi:hypothetical protein